MILKMNVKKFKDNTSRTISFLVFFAFVFHSLGFGAFISSKSVFAAPYGDVVVRATSLQGWSSASVSGGATTFVVDSTTPYGNGALELTTNSATQARAQRTKSISPNINLSTLSKLEYYTKYIAGPDVAAPALQITVNGLTSTASTVTFVYEPYWNGTVDKTGSWQRWDTLASGKFNSATNAGAYTNSAGGPPHYTIAEILATNPNAKITNIRLNVGTYNTNYTVRADGVNLNGVIYDFEPEAPQLPSQPTNLRLNGTQPCGFVTNLNNITPTWDAASGAASYNYEVTLNGSVIYGPVNVGNVTSLTGPFGGEGLSSFRVQAVNEAGTSSWSTPCEVTYDASAPDTPTNLTPSSGTVTNNSSFMMTWNTVPGAVKYHYRTSNNLSGDELGTIIYSDDTSASYYTINESTVNRANNNAPDADYYWQVQAEDAAGNKSAWSMISKVTVDTIAPSIPTNGLPHASYKNTNDFYFTWNPSTDAVGAIAYEFQSSNSASVNPDGSLVGAWNSIQNGNAEQNNLTGPTIHSTGAPDGTYYWQVRAIDTAGNKSAWSETWNMTIDTTKPLAPTTLSLSGTNGLIENNGTTDSYTVTASWGVVADAVNYQYKYWNDIVGNPYKEDSAYIVDVNGLSNTGVFNQGEGIHHFQVRARDAAGNYSDWSETFNVTYSVPPVNAEEPEVPTEPTDPNENTDPTPQTPETENDNNETETEVLPLPTTAPIAPVIAQTALPTFFQNFVPVINDDGTVSAVPAGETNATPEDGEVLGATNSLAKNTAQADAATQKNPMSGIKWYWILAGFAALLAAWWFIAGYRRSRDEKQS